jgi:hypothetical protein
VAGEDAVELVGRSDRALAAARFAASGPAALLLRGDGVGLASVAAMLAGGLAWGLRGLAGPSAARARR